MDAKSSIPEFRHSENVKYADSLTQRGYKLIVTSKGYEVWHRREFIAGAGTLHRPHGRYADANRRDYLDAAVSIARAHLEKL